MRPTFEYNDPNEPGIEEYQATESGYLRIATVKANDTFHPSIFPDLSIDLETLIP